MGDAAAPVELGQLSVEITSESYLLASNLPIEVRDARERLVGQGHGSIDIRVRPGIYRIVATLPDGGRADELVEVQGPEGFHVHFGKEPVSDATRETAGAGEDSPMFYLDTSPGDEPSWPAELVYTKGASARVLQGSWLFQPDDLDDPLTDAPHCAFRIGETTVTASLPINPVGWFPTDTCIVTPVDDGGVRLDVRFARQRLVASNLEGQLRSGAYASPTSFLDSAAGLLLDKYRDPTAAALGGLTLHRLGRLREREEWVANLARDFAWLADGRVLEIALHAQDEDEYERARWLDRLLEVAKMRPMFADGYALLLDLLRRWPDGSGEASRAEAVADITSRIVGVDWNAIALTEYAVDQA
ncbi:hypothetical protein [Agromyces sp. ZXT2-3]|uniref:hypothetical protein n=1 Tax=Agromyces sp. ZXT2-3 TaxID=3461152 RepID=UPI004054BB11